jgi:hypothetical protein
VEVLYEDEPLKEYYTLMDIAYIYPWRRVSLWGGEGVQGGDPCRAWYWSVPPFSITVLPLFQEPGGSRLACLTR